MKRLLLIRQSSALREITEEEVVAALSPEQQRLERRHIELAMSQFADAIEQGDWVGQDQYLREQAAAIREQARGPGEVELHYFGLAEVPHIVALGAHLGGERTIVFHDFDRDNGSWNWRKQEPALDLRTYGADELETVVRARGDAVIRVAISAVVSDEDVREMVGDATVADIAVSHGDSGSAAVARVHSAADVEGVRREFRSGFARLRNARPNLDTVHLFVAASPSVCLAIGQELTLRNSPPIQLYQYRSSADRSAQWPAILLTAEGEARTAQPLTDEEKRVAAQVRTEVWPQALEELETYVANRRLEASGDDLWFAGLRPQIEETAPFPELPKLELLAPENVSVDPEPFSGDYGYEKSTGKGKWRLGDGLLLGLHAATGGDESRLRQLIRLFVIHEYLHDYHCITKHTAEEVGKFPNCLEHLDYIADSYAILHQLDLSRRLDGSLLKPSSSVPFLASQVELAIKSFWAFDVDSSTEWQVRRIRRYLNWYWRLIQLRNAADLSVLKIFRRQPHLEIGGLRSIARGRRVFASLNRRDPSTHLELAIVLENEQLFRIADSPNTNLPELLQAFVHGEHEEITRFFQAVYDLAARTGGVQP